MSIVTFCGTFKKKIQALKSPFAKEVRIIYRNVWIEGLIVFIVCW